MSAVKDGGPAFPGCGQVFTTDAHGRTNPQAAWGMEGAAGMSLRDWFAGMALQGMLAADSNLEAGETSWHHEDNRPTLCRKAYECADEMIRQREGVSA
jgi:hypothetical protein